MGFAWSLHNKLFCFFFNSKFAGEMSNARRSMWWIKVFLWHVKQWSIRTAQSLFSIISVCLMDYLRYFIRCSAASIYHIIENDTHRFPFNEQWVMSFTKNLIHIHWHCNWHTHPHIHTHRHRKTLALSLQAQRTHSFSTQDHGIWSFVRMT